MPVPALPLELEKEIIILAIDCIQQAYSLLFVSQWIHYCDFTRGAVQSLCIEGDVLLSTAADILSLCSGTTNLALWIAPSDFNETTNPLLRPLNDLPLTSLLLSISLIFHYTQFVSLSTFKAFSTVTCLEILNAWVLWNSTRTKPELVASVLTLSHLQVVVFRISEDIEAVQTFLESNSLSDSHIVLASQIPTAWGEFGGDDMSLWKGADQDWGQGKKWARGMSLGLLLQWIHVSRLKAAQERSSALAFYILQASRVWLTYGMKLVMVPAPAPSFGWSHSGMRVTAQLTGYIGKLEWSYAGMIEINIVSLRIVGDGVSCSGWLMRQVCHAGWLPSEVTVVLLRVLSIEGRGCIVMFDHGWKPNTAKPARQPAIPLTTTVVLTEPEELAVEGVADAMVPVLITILVCDVVERGRRVRSDCHYGGKTLTMDNTVCGTGVEEVDEVVVLEVVGMFSPAILAISLHTFGGLWGGGVCTDLTQPSYILHVLLPMYRACDLGFSATTSSDHRYKGDRNALWLSLHVFLEFVLVLISSQHRSMSFKAILRQDSEYFDNDKNNTGALTSSLSKAPPKINGLAGVTLGVIVQSITTILAGMIIVLVYAWKPALVGMACIPVLVSTGFKCLSLF
ncbi:ABC transporter transmembrane region-domain-containing protein [Suillus bovinus]|uniref:ABC transporter transmembrane region-domain-containing protein n=1 Tax=Suillus bovinus TaxID=48563 RepID=UPI001B87F3E7|nr:ABC transporter transmembrane region-domain-containing protein [Suillus bovinus]KAG2159781.1 ABC transporter transmembrane region-domain-containing protein [Suillus bovinus]